MRSRLLLSHFTDEETDNGRISLAQKPVEVRGRGQEEGGCDGESLLEMPGFGGTTPLPLCLMASVLWVICNLEQSLLAFLFPSCPLLFSSPCPTFPPPGLISCNLQFSALPPDSSVWGAVEIHGGPVSLSDCRTFQQRCPFAISHVNLQMILRCLDSPVPSRGSDQ